MKMNSFIFVIAFIVSFAGGYFFFTAGDAPDTDSAQNTATSQENAADAEKEADSQAGDTSQTEETAQVTDQAEALSRNNCLSCHALDSIGIEGGTTGPDLSQAVTNVEGKHGKSIEEFLQEPTSAVMSSVIDGNPLSDDERAKIIEELEKAAEQ